MEGSGCAASESSERFKAFGFRFKEQGLGGTGTREGSSDPASWVPLEGYSDTSSAACWILIRGPYTCCSQVHPTASGAFIRCSKPQSLEKRVATTPGTSSGIHLDLQTYRHTPARTPAHIHTHMYTYIYIYIYIYIYVCVYLYIQIICI